MASVEFSGVLQSIRFQKDSFIIGKLDNGTGIKGNMLTPQVGMEYVFHGRMEHHSKFGDTFVFTDYHATLPTDSLSIRVYLMENCKWIGPEVSKNLVNRYGKESLVICKTDPKRVAKEVNGITLERAEQVSRMLLANEANEQLQIELNGIFEGVRIPKRVTTEILDMWGAGALARIRENPFALITAVRGVGFVTADSISLKVGFKRDGAPRIRAGILHTLKEQASFRGHTAMPESLFLEAVTDLLKLPEKTIAKEIDMLAKDGAVATHHGRVCLKAYFEDEQMIGKKLKEMQVEHQGVKGVAYEPTKEDAKELFEDQIEAIKKAVANGVFILTGAPGTGKTFTIKKIISMFPGVRVNLAAPTGKAAKRMFEQSGMKATTIHKLLEPRMGKDGKFEFARGPNFPVDTDLLVLDEVSMIDVSLFAKLLSALRSKTRLILVGDTHQLPAVGAGNVLRDCIASKLIPTTELTIIKRQDAGLIIRNCHAIKNGQDIKVDNEGSKDFFFMQERAEEDMVNTIKALVKTRLPVKFQVDPLRDIQVLSPLREKTPLSCKSLNPVLQELLNPNPALKESRFRVGDKVIQLKNDYDRDIINGDIGYITDIDLKTRQIHVTFENPERQVEVHMYSNDLDLAYVVTCHKYQGSEAPIIIVPVHRSFGPLMMQRNWLYTAVSRAKRVCVVVGQRDEVVKAIARNQQQKRHTLLGKFLNGKKG